MATLKECMGKLAEHGIDARRASNPGVHYTVKRLCLAGFPLEEIVFEILLVENLMLLNATMPDGDTLSEDDRRTAIKLLRQGKSIDEVFKQLRPRATRKTKPL
jgi:hypothetical protein